MNLRYINWPLINEKAEWNLTLQYHKYSEYGTYSEKTDLNRREMIDFILQNSKQDITTGKRYLTSNVINVDNLTSNFENKVRDDLEIVNDILFKGAKLCDLNINNSNLKLFNKYVLKCNPEKSDELSVYYYNFNNRHYENTNTTSISSFQSVLIKPTSDIKIAIVITFNLRFLVEFYGEAAYRLGLLETGAILEEILKSQNTFTKSIIRFKDQKLNSLLNLKGNAEIPLAILL